ncbi:MBL fold metallo-hydrolase [Methylomonas sp. MgM2]
MKANYTDSKTYLRRWRLAVTLAVLACAGSALANEAALSVRVLGSGGPELSDQRASTSYLISLNGKARVLLDTGPGSSLHFESSGANFNSIDALLYSHLHVDHSADLPAYIKAGYFSGRNRDLPVYGPDGNAVMPSTAEFVEGLFGDRGVYRYLREYFVPGVSGAYKLKVHNVVTPNDGLRSVRLTPDINATAVNVPHGPIPALAWRVESEDCAVTFTGDTNRPGTGLTKLAHRSDLLIAHHAVPEHAAEVALSLHMPPSAIGKLAADAGVKRLVLSHRMQRTRNSEAETLKIIRTHFAGPVEFAEDEAVYRPCR